uniref:TIR domain-containing protein n=1 Tax=Neogobius melanostomus TaxID=47308 RepID=A0A8C6T1K9_9GOBI
MNSLFSLLIFLLLSRPSLFYSVTNCTADVNDQNILFCEENRLTTIPPGLPKTATFISLHKNRIDKIRQTDLTGFTRLETLFISNNDLSALTELNIKSNHIKHLTDNLFKGLSNLLYLDISGNPLKLISKFAFAPLKNLQELNMLNSFDQNMTLIISHTPSLKTLEIETGSLEAELFPFPLLNLTKLEFHSFDMKRFSIHSDVLPQLKYLVLLGNGPDFEWDVSNKSVLKSVKHLELSLMKVTTETYETILRSVDSVDYLELTSFGHLFDQRVFDVACGIKSLQKLNLSYRNMSILDDTLLRSCVNLRELTFFSNALGGLSESSLRTMTRLTHLEIESNKLSRIPVAIRNMSSLTHLSFQSNQITKLQCPDFLNLTSLQELNLNSNRISKLKECVFKDLKYLKVLFIERNLLSQLDYTFGTSFPSLVRLNANENYLGLVQKGTFDKMIFLTDLNVTSKSATNVENGVFEGLSILKTLTFSQSFQSGCVFEGLEKLQHFNLFISNDKEMTVSEPMSFNISSLQELTLEVDKNVCIDHALYSLHNMNKSKVFSLSAICCYTPSDSFLETPHLLNLQMTNCAEFSPHPELFQPITELQTLDLSQNNIKSLDFLTGANLTKVQTLILANNKLRIINETVFEALPSLKYLDLSGNPFTCDCSNAGFIEWAVNNKQVQVANGFQYRCSFPLPHDGHFLILFNVQSCFQDIALLCFLCSSALVLVTLLSSIIYHFMRWQLVYGYYLLLAYLYDSKKRRQGSPHMYDAFVSYNVHDEEWVFRKLLPELEGRQGWRLCLHHRDFLPGKPIIENITDAIYSSRKTLCVISRHYLQSEWCSREIQMDVLILLFLEELSSNQLSPFYRIRKLVRSRTYLSWSQARRNKALFWEKVRTALENGDNPVGDQLPANA